MLRANTMFAGALRRSAYALAAARNTRGAAAAAAAAANDRAANTRTQHIVLSLAGADRVGLVHQFTRTALDHEANVEETRMARLGGEFAIIGMLSLEPAIDIAAVTSAYEKAFPGFSVTCRPTSSQEDADKLAAGKGHQEWSLELEGPDSPGIVAAISEELAKSGSSIHQMDTETHNAPFAGFPLFKLNAVFSVNPANIDDVLKAMTSVEDRYGVSISMGKGPGDDANNPSVA